jgi:hypothetical protein
MTTIVALLAFAASVIALAAACVLVAKATAVLRNDMDELKARDRFVAPSVPEVGRGTHRMMNALYPERASRLDWLTGIPAWPGFAAAAVLALAGGLLGLAGPAPAAPAPDEQEAEVATLRATVDSLTGRVRTLSDSLRLVVADSVKPAARSARATARLPRRPAPTKAASVPASPVLPPPPSLQQIQAGTQPAP